MAEQPIQKVTDNDKMKVRFHYIKSNFYRPIFVDGLIGAVTPRGNIQMSVYVEHAPIPQQTVSIVDKSGALGKEKQEDRVVKEGIVRDVEATLIMSEETANAMINWLKDRIEDIAKLKQQVKAQNTNG
jgi:hypothetical protein